MGSLLHKPTESTNVYCESALNSTRIMHWHEVLGTRLLCGFLFFCFKQFLFLFTGTLLVQKRQPKNPPFSPEEFNEYAKVGWKISTDSF